MNNEKDFYDILRSKFNEKEEPFDEANWKSMRKMIDASRAKDKRTLFIAASLCLLLLAGGTFALLEMKGVPGSEAGKGKISVTSSQNLPGKNSGQTSTVNNNQPVNSTNAIAASANANTPSNASNELNNQETSAKNTKASGVNTVAVLSPAKNKRIIKHHAKSAQSLTGKFALNNNNNETAISNELNAIEKDTKVENVISMKEGTPNTAPASIGQVTTSSSITKAKSPANTTVHKADSAIIGPSEPLRFSDEPRIFNGKKQMISMDAGGFYSGGWQATPTTTQGKGFNYVFGVGYTRYLKSKIFLKTGLQFSDFGNMSSYTYNYQTTLHQSPNIVGDSVITTKRLYYLTIPLQVEYFYYKKWSLNVGATFSYLFTTTASATAYQQVDNNPPINIHTYSQNIQLQGYNKFNSTIFALDRYTFNRHFSVYGGIYFGLTPIENKSFFGETISAEDKAGFKLLLSYTL